MTDHAGRVSGVWSAMHCQQCICHNINLVTNAGINASAGINENCVIKHKINNPDKIMG